MLAGRKIVSVIFLLLIVKTLILPVAFSQIAANHILTDIEIFSALKTSVPELRRATDLFYQGKVDSAKMVLTSYFKIESAERYYFNWKRFGDRFLEYQAIYPEAKKDHYNLAKYQMKHFRAETHWQLPFQDLTGEDVTAYQLRHLARQQKSADMALVYYYENEDVQYLDYFVRQVADLNRAFAAGVYDDAGNGIYEYFRAGKRIHNWLFAHHAYLASEKYDWLSQYLVIKTFLHHGAQLQQRIKRYSPGNHHTKGLVALFEIAVLFPEFSGAETWQKQAIDGLMEHMDREINDDGFQFERSVHYHKGDIENYFRVYQLAKQNSIELPEEFYIKFRKLFEALILLARPDRKLPVLQDDTDIPLADYNDLDDAMTLGAIVFQDPTYKYFAADKVFSGVYWLFREEQFDQLQKVKAEAPTFGSISLPKTGYYIMRNGWDLNDCHMVITAGLSREKPDHQHADMLGLVAYANGHAILPNYQVKYNYPDFIEFKNSWVKNVALADSIPQGIQWKPNSGGSGFGKWLNLPEPEVLAWVTAEDFDYFAGKHNGYIDIGVDYTRELLFVKEGYWVVKDKFKSTENHTYQQLWQGDYTVIDNRTVRADYQDGSGLVIKQLSEAIYKVLQGQNRDKKNILFTVQDQQNFSFTTILFPFNSEANQNPDRISLLLPENNGKIIVSKRLKIMAEWIIRDTSGNYFAFGLNELSNRKTRVVFSQPSTIVIRDTRKGFTFTYLGDGKNTMSVTGQLVTDRSNRPVSGKITNILTGSIYSIIK